MKKFIIAVSLCVLSATSFSKSLMCEDNAVTASFATGATMGAIAGTVLAAAAVTVATPVVVAVSAFASIPVLMGVSGSQVVGGVHEYICTRKARKEK